MKESVGSSQARHVLASRLVVSNDWVDDRMGKAASGHHLNTLIVLASTSNDSYSRRCRGRGGARVVAQRRSRLATISDNVSRTSKHFKDNVGTLVAFSPQEPNGAHSQLQHLAIRGGASDTKDKEFKKELYKAIQNLLAGAIAGGSVETALYPIDTIKTRLQAAKGSMKWADKVKTLRGSSNLYSGLMGNLVGVIPASALFFSVYEPVKEKLLDPKVGIPGWCAQFTAAATAAVSASFIRVPTEVVKSRMQVGQFKSAVVALKSITAQEGIQGLYAGYKSFLLRDITFDVIEFVSYEQLRELYLKRKGKQAANKTKASQSSSSFSTRPLPSPPLLLHLDCQSL